MATAWQKSAWPAGVWRHWLTDRGSLTRRLQSLYSGFGVARLEQRMTAPHLDEVAPLGLYPGHLALVREVLLKNDGTPLVFAHSVIPPTGHVDAPPRALWARRSLFSLENHPILVTEVFLPALLEPR